jgi:hypothetical protein
VVSHQPSDISHLKKSVPLSPAECITFAAVAALALANNVRKDSGKSSTFAADRKNKSACTFSEKCLHNLERVLALPENGHKAKCNIFLIFKTKKNVTDDYEGA